MVSSCRFATQPKKSASGSTTRTLTAYTDREFVLSNDHGAQVQVLIQHKDGFQLDSQSNSTTQFVQKQEEYDDDMNPTLVSTNLPAQTMHSDESSGGDFDASGTIDASGNLVWNTLTSESRWNQTTTPGDTNWNPQTAIEGYYGDGFNQLQSYLGPVSHEVYVPWDEGVGGVLAGMQTVGLHSPEYAGGRSNDTQFVSEQSNGNHNTNYQLNGAYQNLDPNTTIDFETPWGLLSGLKNTEESSSSEPVEEPTEGEGTEGEECDCACGDGLSPTLTAIHTYEIWDDGGTPEFPDDDVLIGYAVTEFYGEPWGNTTIYDMDGNEVEPDENGEYPPQYNAQNSDWRLINEENIGTSGSPFDLELSETGKRVVEAAKVLEDHVNVIQSIRAKISAINEKLPNSRGERRKPENRALILERSELQRKLAVELFSQASSHKQLRKELFDHWKSTLTEADFITTTIQAFPGTYPSTVTAPKDPPPEWTQIPESEDEAWRNDAIEFWGYALIETATGEIAVGLVIRVGSKLIPIGKVAVKQFANKADEIFDCLKRIQLEVDPSTVGMSGGNIRIKLGPKGIEFPTFRLGDSITTALPDGSYPRWFARECHSRQQRLGRQPDVGGIGKSSNGCCQ
ncbi:hypothetical protein [Rubinisphaera italica]|uniref:Uncharacterized protein n=1 Tax=Rubinisphaera italica TaxID=2527969 RepID=A0A5C5XF70_9PLAN|nr:hypothetical protein [Rubinisphaera italica]TWT61736.1 hypothetical protein Pan54_24730 [Rubinisphaera italica]